MTPHPTTALTLQVGDEAIDFSEELLEKYNVPGPRYTSYPTAPEWRDDFGPDDMRRALAESNADGRPLSLYVHLPFCERLCLFCGCNVVIDRRKDRVLPPYLERLHREIEALSGQLSAGRPVVQVHWGGGTPTYLPPAECGRLAETLRGAFSITADAEVSVEVDPRVTTPAHLEALARSGFNRVSMGVQDFDPTVQATIRRVQSFEATRDLVEAARGLGFDSVNLDLIYGLPHQDPETFGATIDQIVALAPDRIAMYSFAYVPWLKKQQRSFRHHLPQGRAKFEIFRRGIEGLTAAGYEYIGMDHFARQDDELARALREGTMHRNFQGYSTRARADLVAIGVSSISSFHRAYAQNHRSLAAYDEAIDAGRLATMRGLWLSDDDVLRRAVIERVLCHRRLDPDEVSREFGIDFDEVFAEALPRLEDLIRDGLLDREGRVYRATPLGTIFLRNVAMVFDRYLSDRRSDRPRFSKTL